MNRPSTVWEGDSADASVLTSDAGASWVDEDWAPPAEIIRRLARITVSQTTPDVAPRQVISAAAGSMSAIDASAQKGMDKLVMTPQKPTGYGVRLQVGDDKDQMFGATLDTTLASGRSLSRTQSVDSVSSDGGSPGKGNWMGRTMSPQGFDASTDQGSSPTKSGRSSPSKSPKSGGVSRLCAGGDQHWMTNHDTAWDGSVFRSRAEGLYTKATPKVCCCTRAFEPGVNRCVKCGTRRPVTAPDKVSQTVKAQHASDPHMHYPEPYERNYLWAAVYEQKKYNLQLASFGDEEEFYVANGNFNPQLSGKSVEITEGMKPIHERCDEILFKREEYLTMRRQQVYDSEVCKECTFCPRLHPKSIGMQGRDRRSLYRWENRRALKINQLLNNQLEVESKDCPFAPELSVASRRIAEEYSNRNVHDRLVQDAKRRVNNFHSEQLYQKTLQPDAFADAPTGERAGSPRKRAGGDRRRPQSAHPGSRDSPDHLKAMRCLQPGTVSKADRRARSASNSVSPRLTAKGIPRPHSATAARASMVVLPSGSIVGSPVRDGRSVRERKNAPSVDRRSTSAPRGTACWQRFSQNGDQPRPPPPKSVLMNGKNLVKFQPHFADIIWNIQTKEDLHPHDDY